jgi:hypothetical protein
MKYAEKTKTSTTPTARITVLWWQVHCSTLSTLHVCQRAPWTPPNYTDTNFAIELHGPKRAAPRRSCQRQNAVAMVGTERRDTVRGGHRDRDDLWLFLMKFNWGFLWHCSQLPGSYSTGPERSYTHQCNTPQALDPESHLVNKSSRRYLLIKNDKAEMS